MKDEIQSRKRILKSQFYLTFGGRILNENCKVSDYSIQQYSTLSVQARILGSSPETTYLNLSKNDLDPGYDYDFTHQVDDGTKFFRCGKEYKRPYGYYRYAVKVLGKYEDDKWLGSGGIRSNSVDGEWPVSYHGTNPECITKIMTKGYKPGDRKLFGEGVYMSPSIDVAEQYSQNSP